MRIKIGTLNIQNRMLEYKDKISILGKHIYENNYYFLSTQELNKKTSLKLSKELNKYSNYKLYGGYRLGSNVLVNKIKLLDHFNENNAIITNKNVIYVEDNKLPWIPNKMEDFIESISKITIVPRIATGIMISNSKKDMIFVINTHLDYHLPNIQRRQLKSLLKLIEEVIPYFKVIITGDFNMEITDESFNSFIESLNQLNIKRVEVNDKTHDDHKTAIDHIFIPDSWYIEDAGIMNDKDLLNITDHKGVYAKINTNK